ncbi:uncharacterized protein GGS22DRAFT_69663 [Annulohypoxylon maeteangense]|uniref:uncharacterized protein n=1 Tax=Annulohypoxylon maeteangense TaxID=1927788 RepID=UPI002007D646|nr:uncharacterized protein GGS22DRAFT_69663 [Annulohypoxylon maeteangense]KAI0889297.1 hypothetical protein GGS22DRAFT_69663 [Annulohypoxylon maeteangense]
MGHLYPTKRLTLFFICTIFSNFTTGSIWAQFCDDEACSVNCGFTVSVSNPGCLGREWGRKSVKLHGQDFVGSYLVSSPDDNCGCQNDCITIPGAGLPTCIDLSKKAIAQSYRFQLTTCKKDEAGSGQGVGDNCNVSSSADLLLPTTLPSSARISTILNMTSIVV